MARDFESRVVAITGAGKGLGRAYALYLAGLGARIVVNNRRHGGAGPASADLLVDRIRKSGGEAVAEYSSVEEPESGQRLLDRSLEAFGRLDAVVANAGISEACTFHKQHSADFRRLIEINLLGTAFVLQPTFRYFYEQRRGSLVACTSGAGLYGEHGLPAYSASKAALLGLVRSLALEGAAHGVRVNALAPYASTQMTEDSLPESVREKLAPDCVAPVLAWLVSGECPLNGEFLVTGAGRLSIARMMESHPAELPGGPDYDPDAMLRLVNSLRERLPENSYAGALKQFETFILD
jgi:NAD(P)-dependent dehydrogenase (short-subunit alcohol dehydrogenase family)